jgi:hypothetical protein
MAIFLIYFPSRASHASIQSAEPELGPIFLGSGGCTVYFAFGVRFCGEAS